MKKCNCGETLDIRLRTVIYSRLVEVDNVPIYSCESCGHTEILTGVKPHLTSLIAKLGSEPQQQKLNFEEINEWAYLISRAIDRELMNESIQHIVSERVDQLLDMMLLARSLHDYDWEDELRERLSQITNTALTT